MTPASFADRLAVRLKATSISLNYQQIELLADYWRLLARWNTTVNLTSLPLQGYPVESLDRLIVEPLVAAQLMPSDPIVWLDLGSGGGSPAIPLKIVVPEARLTMVESRSRKAAFLREIVRSLGLPRTDVANARVEEVAEERAGTANCVTVRAVRLDGALARAALRLLIPEGRLISFDATTSIRDVPYFEVIQSIPIPTTGSLARAFVPRGTNHLTQ